LPNISVFSQREQSTFVHVHAAAVEGGARVCVRVCARTVQVGVQIPLPRAAGIVIRLVHDAGVLCRACGATLFFLIFPLGAEKSCNSLLKRSEGFFFWLFSVAPKQRYLITTFTTHARSHTQWRGQQAWFSLKEGSPRMPGTLPRWFHLSVR
jgi:hypothetical protein